MPSPSPTKDFPRLAPPTPTTPSIHTNRSSHQLHSPASSSTLTGRPIPASPSPQRTLRKLASAHNLGAGSAANLRASIANPPSLIAQQRLHHQPPRRTTTVSPTRRYASISGSSNRIVSSSVRNNRSSPTRGRPNSDAPIVHQLNAAAAAMSSISLRNSGTLNSRSAYDHIPLEKLIRDGPPDGNWDNAVECARLKVLQQEIKSDPDGMSNLRIYVWLIMLDAPMLSTDEYLSLVHRAASPAYAKIRNDTFRTLTTDPLFRRRVSEASLIRLLNAIAWKLHDSRPQQVVTLNTRQSLPAISDSHGHSHDNLPIRGSTTPTPRDSAHQRPGTSPAAKNRARALTLTTEGSETSVASEAGIYVQGMNVLAAPFLYAARSEAEAFTAFHRLLTREVPGYIRGAMDGVHRGLALVDKVLGIVDPKLSMYLTSKGLSAELYAFPSVLTLCACTPPLPEVLRLWDFLFAYGPHLNIVCIAAQLVTHRDELMASPNPSHFLRTFPALNAEKVQAMTLALLAKLPDDVYAEIVSHAM